MNEEFKTMMLIMLIGKLEISKEEFIQIGKITCDKIQELKKTGRFEGIYRDMEASFYKMSREFMGS